MSDSRDITWMVREQAPFVEKSPTDPCGASCHECGSAWRCEVSDGDCETPYALHKCEGCRGPALYVCPYWVRSGQGVRDRRTQTAFKIVAVVLGRTRQQSAAEICPVAHLGEPSANLRSMVERIGISDLEDHFEPLPR